MVLVVERKPLSLYLVVQYLVRVQGVQHHYELCLLLPDLTQTTVDERLSVHFVPFLINLEYGLQLLAHQHVLLIGVILSSLRVDKFLVVQVEPGIQKLGHLQTKAKVPHKVQTIVHLI